MALIECCLSNVSSDMRKALSESDHEVRETFCLDRCGICYNQQFLVIDGELHGEIADLNSLSDIDVEAEGLKE